MERFRQPGLLALLTLLFVLIALLGLTPRSHQVNLELGRAQQALAFGSPQEAAQHLASAAEHLPGRDDIWELAGGYALEGGDPVSAILYLERANRGGLSVEGLIDLGDAYQQVGDLPAAIRSWQAVLITAGPSTQVSQRILQAHRTLGDYSSAIVVLQALIAQQPEEAQWHYQLGLLTAIRHPESALDHLAQAGKLDSSLTIPAEKLRRGILDGQAADDPAYALLTIGRALASLEEWELAAEAFRQAVQVRPDYAAAWAYLGGARQYLTAPANPSSSDITNSDDGLYELEKALALDPNLTAAHTFLALYWARRGEYDLALEAIQIAISLEPEEPDLRVEAGRIFAMSGDLHAAYEAYYHATALAPQALDYLRFLADFSLNYEFQIQQTALPVARRAVILAPQDPRSLDLMAQVLIKLGDLVNAERFLHRTLQVDPEYAPAHLHLGQIYILRDNYTDAYQALNLANSLASDSTIADQARRLLQTYFP